MRITGFGGWLMSLVCLLAGAGPLGAQPSIQITELPPYGTDGLLRGEVAGVDPTAYRVMTYIHLEGYGWVRKPWWDPPTVPIAPDGTFEVDVVTGGFDDRAVIFHTALVAAGFTPQTPWRSASVPDEPGFAAVDYQHRYGPSVQFAGRTWAVKDGPVPVGPGDNYFSTDAGHVWVDPAGLHLSVRRDGQTPDKWWASEVMLTESHGYGTYAFQTDSRLDVLDAKVVFGAYTWDPFGDDASIPAWPYREIDFEDSRWNNPADPTNAQMVVQPWYVDGNLHRYALPDLTGDAALTRLFTWEPDRIEFVALQGHYPAYDYPEEAVIERWVYEHDPAAGHIVPPPGREQFRFNLYPIHGSDPPAAEVEVLINDFSFTPKLTWSGGDGDWDTPQWSNGLQSQSPAGGEQMLVESGSVRVEQNQTGALAAASLAVEGAEVSIDAGVELEVLGLVRVGPEATLAVDGLLDASRLVIDGPQEDAPGGTLQGGGTIAAETVLIAGLLSPGGSEAGLSSSTAVVPASGGLVHAVPEPTALRMLVGAVLAMLAGWRWLAGAAGYTFPTHSRP